MVIPLSESGFAFVEMLEYPSFLHCLESLVAVDEL